MTTIAAKKIVELLFENFLEFLWVFDTGGIADDRDATLQARRYEHNLCSQCFGARGHTVQAFDLNTVFQGQIEVSWDCCNDTGCFDCEEPEGGLVEVEGQGHHQIHNSPIPLHTMRIQIFHEIVLRHLRAFNRIRMASKGCYRSDNFISEIDVFLTRGHTQVRHHATKMCILCDYFRIVSNLL